jgi:hypothetical protein
MNRLLLVGLLLFSVCAVAGSRSRKDIPPAPLPTVVTGAKKIFLANGGGSDLAYDAFYNAMKTWGHYTIVGTPEDADLIVELAYRVEHGGTRTWATSNGSATSYGNTTTYNGGTQIHTREIPDPQLVLTIYDAKSKQSVWSATDHRRLARLEKNREKETINSAERLADELKTRVGTSQ